MPLTLAAGVIAYVSVSASPASSAPSSANSFAFSLWSGQAGYPNAGRMPRNRSATSSSRVSFAPVSYHSRRATSWIDIELLHTPGHTPGSQCFLLDGRLVAGDTLFLDGCGRTDFPGGDVDEMFRSLQQLSKLSGDPTVFPGHWYSAEPSAPLENVKRTNYVYRASNLDQWRTLMGG